jgi:hypothetical protein
VIAQYKRNTNWGVGLGIAMQVLGNSLANNGLLAWFVFGAGSPRSRRNPKASTSSAPEMSLTDQPCSRCIPHIGG